jgi:hypothetical protein
LAVALCARFSVSGFIFYSFVKKIEWAKAGTRNISANYFKDKAHGMIVFLYDSKLFQKLIDFLLVGDDLRIDYKSFTH